MTPEDYLGGNKEPPKSKWITILIESIHWAATLFAFMCAVLFFIWALYETAPRQIEPALPVPAQMAP